MTEFFNFFFCLRKTPRLPREKRREREKEREKSKLTFQVISFFFESPLKQREESYQRADGALEQNLFVDERQTMLVSSNRSSEVGVKRGDSSLVFGLGERLREK